MTIKRSMIRAAITVALPFCMIWAFAEELWRGLRSALRLAWLEVRANLASFREMMKREDY
ncbi:hypothetical protein [Bradyrhizobium zhanjiangense]|uniref:Uncharacterized protein n=1 Tax=Bradyrhizobium zhanjiangense TaxID=1325107 RepID=A0ABY0DHU4_9BRAD|nr:hypothetical protein [Bradyrhizobium zhanjiangense]RXG91546.1 hypothetical protein EAS62_24000 [Bradyrhizobium zhanjiangense]